MNFRENEEAVSPVIGVILMVAITVILAAVIAAFVFGMSGNIDTNKQVAATATATTNATAKTISITYMGGPDAQIVTGINYTKNADEPKPLNATGHELIVGTTCQVDGAQGEKDHIVVTAFFTDGSSQVILDTNV
ncbi:MAG TPA: type IV pilin N-terminal domain-containing protein [Methanoculleus sp.]|nr:type IV pilin N-terminal domain-containing protein [Methanoculleus sp.]